MSMFVSVATHSKFCKIQLNITMHILHVSTPTFNISMDSVFVDMGTTGIAFTIQNPGKDYDNKVFTVSSQHRNLNITSKFPTTLHIYQKPNADIFDDSTILQRSYFGDDPTQSFTAYVRQYPKGIDYVFHGLKSVVYQKIKEISPNNVPKLRLESIKVFRVALMILKDCINSIRKSTQPFRLVFLVPASSDADLKDFIKGPIIEIFSEVDTSNIDMFYFLKEPVAATSFAIKNLIDSNVTLRNHGPKYNTILLIDMGGGTCDFNIVHYKGDEKKLDKKYQVVFKNEAVFAGGYNVDKNFLEFLCQTLPKSTPEQKFQCLKKFMQNKMNWQLRYKKYEIDFDADDYEGDEKDLFGQPDGIFGDIKFDREEALENQIIEVTPEIMKICFDEVFEQIQQNTKSYYNAVVKQEPIDHVIIVGGFSDSFYIKEKMTKLVKELAGFDPNFINQGSLAIIKGARMLFEESGGQIGGLIGVDQFMMENDVFFMCKDEDNQECKTLIFSQGSSYEKDQKDVQLKNLIAVGNSQATKAVIHFFSEKKDPNGNVIERNNFDFLIDIVQGKTYKASLKALNGYQLQLFDQQTSTLLKTYETSKGPIAATKKQTIFILIDVTWSMEPFVRAIKDKLKPLIQKLSENQQEATFLFYSDFQFQPRAGFAESTATSNLSQMYAILDQQIAEIRKQEGKENDYAEDLLPAFERAAGIGKIDKNKITYIEQEQEQTEKVIIVIGDCCAHTHQGCECEQSQKYQSSGVPPEKRQDEVNRHYSCQKCAKDCVGLDSLLSNPQLVQEHRARWEQVCSKLQKTRILFVPVLQENYGYQRGIKPDLIDVKHKYVSSGCSILKTHRMMWLMGCEQLKTLQQVGVENFVEGVQEAVAEVAVRE